MNALVPSIRFKCSLRLIFHKYNFTLFLYSSHLFPMVRTKKRVLFYHRVRWFNLYIKSYFPGTFQEGNGTSFSVIEKTSNIKHIELPLQERLLPIGLRRDSVTGLVDCVRHVLGISRSQGEYLIIK